MDIPTRSPALKWALLLLTLPAFVWLALEGNLAGDLLLGGAGLAVLAVYVVMRFWGGRSLTTGQLIVLCALTGLALGLALAPATFLLMALKTGLHAHGPEYSSAEIAWVWAQWPLWAGAGALAGAGLGMVLAGISRR